ncbi:hypothetical protein IWX78_002130 [Mycetocola sp. CAN_C7]|uniref:class I SAM-dependent methyltransferase n=1 Tax=Mycetocola sp. CAN_C7 TaxID=2787724 RepID=UPI0018CA6381
MPVGTITRGTTNTNRLRRVDRWMQTLDVVARSDDPLVVDLGYGASAVTSLELHTRLSTVRSDVEVIGLEIDPARVRSASAQLVGVRAGRTSFSPTADVSFAVGGFEVPLAGARRPAVIRAFNVLRQYDESAVTNAWSLMTSRLQPGGILVEGTCDEIGRVASWIAVSPDGPQSLTVSLRLADLERPSIVAERLPKALIHHNVPGERIYDLMAELDRQWQYAAPLAVYGPVQRWQAALAGVADAGWPLEGRRTRWRLGEFTVAWAAVA